MDQDRVGRVLALFERRGEVEAKQRAGDSAARACLARAEERFAAARSATAGVGALGDGLTTAYDAYRMAAESVVLAAGYRVPAVQGAHRITFDIASAAVGADVSAFTEATADRFHAGHHEAEYFDPDRPVEKTEGDARWALDKASSAVEAVRSALS